MDPIYEPATGHEELPHVPSPYDGKTLTAGNHLTISWFWLGTNFLWGAMLGPVVSSQMTVLHPQDPAGMGALILGLGAIPAILVPLIAGALSDRCTHAMGRRRPYILWGTAGGLLGLVLMLLATNQASIPLYFVGWFVLQTGVNAAIAAYSGVIPDIVPEDQRGIASGYMALMSNVGTLLGTLVGGFLIREHAPIVYASIVGMLVIFTALTIAGLREGRLEGPVPKLEWGPYFKSLFKVLVDFKDFRWVWITRALMMTGFYALSPNILYFLRDMVGMEKPESSAGLMFLVILVGATISALIGGKISDNVGRKPVVYWATGIIAVMSLAFIVCHSFVLALALGTIFGIGYGAYISVDWALGADVLPAKKHAGKDMAVWHIAMTLPQTVATPFAGLMLGLSSVKAADGSAKYTSTGFAMLFGFAAIMFALSGYLVRNVKGAK